MKKRFLVTTMALAIATLSLTACGTNDKVSVTDKTTVETHQTTEADTTTTQSDIEGDITESLNNDVVAETEDWGETTLDHLRYFFRQTEETEIKGGSSEKKGFELYSNPANITFADGSSVAYNTDNLGNRGIVSWKVKSDGTYGNLVNSYFSFSALDEDIINYLDGEIAKMGIDTELWVQSLSMNRRITPEWDTITFSEDKNTAYFVGKGGHYYTTDGVNHYFDDFGRECWVAIDRQEMLNTIEYNCELVNNLDGTYTLTIHDYQIAENYYLDTTTGKTVPELVVGGVETCGIQMMWDNGNEYVSYNSDDVLATRDFSVTFYSADVAKDMNVYTSVLENGIFSSDLLGMYEVIEKYAESVQ